MKIFLDTELTDLADKFGPICLISAGFVAQNGSEFYFELKGYNTLLNVEKQDCSKSSAKISE